MTKLCSFTVPGTPIAQPRQRHRILSMNGRSFAQNYTPAKAPVNVFKASVQHAAAEHYQGAPVDGPVHLAISFHFPRPKNKVWKTRRMPAEWHTKKPDMDNVVKAVKDALSGLLWRDDSQVCQYTIAKWMSAGDEQPRTEVNICALSQDIPALI